MGRTSLNEARGPIAYHSQPWRVQGTSWASVRGQPVLPKQLFAASRLKIDARRVVADRAQQARVHYAEPQRREVGEGEHSEVAAPQRGPVVEVGERLVAGAGVSME